MAGAPASRDRWLGIELRHFAALAAVAQERSFRGAAERLGYVQSAISRQIAFLEQLTGARLIERSQGPRPVHLTEAGERLLGHATDILATIDAAKSDIARLHRDRSSDVRVGVFPGVPTRVMPPALVAFGKRYPGVRVAATEALTDAPLLDLLRKGGVDLAFAHLPVDAGPFAACELLRVPWVLLVPAGAEIAAGSRAPTPAEIARLPLIVPTSPRMDPWTRAGLWPEAGQPRIVFRSDVVQTVQALAGAGLGAAIVPRLAIDEGDPRTAVVELGDLLPPAVVGLAWLRDRELSDAAGQFRDLLIQVSSAIERHEGGSRRFARRSAADTAASAG